MTQTFAHAEHARSSYAGTQSDNDSGPNTIPESAYRHTTCNTESPKKSKPASERDSFLTILLRALGAPHI
jgi:hypothetical protein